MDPSPVLNFGADWVLGRTREARLKALRQKAALKRYQALKKGRSHSTKRFRGGKPVSRGRGKAAYHKGKFAGRQPSKKGMIWAPKIPHVGMSLKYDKYFVKKEFIWNFNMANDSFSITTADQANDISAGVADTLHGKTMANLGLSLYYKNSQQNNTDQNSWMFLCFYHNFATSHIFDQKVTSTDTSTEATILQKNYAYGCCRKIAMSIRFKQRPFNPKTGQQYNLQAEYDVAAPPAISHRTVTFTWGQYQHYTHPNSMRQNDPTMYTAGSGSAAEPGEKVDTIGVLDEHNFNSARRAGMKIHNTKMGYSMVWKPKYQDDVLNNAGSVIQKQPDKNTWLDTKTTFFSANNTFKSPFAVFKIRRPPNMVSSSAALFSNFEMDVSLKFYFSFCGRRHNIYQPFGANE